jgi:hypothetical protein
VRGAANSLYMHSGVPISELSRKNLILLPKDFNEESCPLGGNTA